MDTPWNLSEYIFSTRGGSDSYYQNYGKRKRGAVGYEHYGDDDSDDDNDHNEEYSSYYGQSQNHGPIKRQRYDYDDNGAASMPDVASAFQSLPSVIQKGDRTIGLALLGSGAIITMLGVSLFFNKALMRLGNLLFIAGVPMLLGPTRTMGYFLKPEKFRATACLAVGIFLVLVGSPVFGIALEIFGLLNLFGNMFPVILAIAKNMPVIGPILSGNNNGNHRNDNNNSNRYRGDQDYGRGRYNGDYYEGDRDYYDDGYGRRNDYDDRNPYY